QRVVCNIRNKALILYMENDQFHTKIGTGHFYLLQIICRGAKLVVMVDHQRPIDDLITYSIILSVK
ncbi:TPA: hypothetical protein ACGBJ8_004573, partial [Escherichia coli]